MKKNRRSGVEKEASIQQQLREQEAMKKLKKEAERKRLEEIKLDQQCQEALLRHHEMVL